MCTAGISPAGRKLRSAVHNSVVGARPQALSACTVAMALAALSLRKLVNLTSGSNGGVDFLIKQKSLEGLGVL